ncbi:DUF350 domain-containing protein [Candidatus Micrarchaeota archaeon]|nr:DUF350 domain-containing protein [Candidatus Micrarchaeota archaeon]
MELLAQIGLDLARMLIGIITALVFSAGALYTGMGLLDRLTSGIDEWKEIKKGNAAVGLLYAAVMISMMLLIGPRIAEIVYPIQNDMGLPATQLVVLLLFTLVNYLAGLLSAIVLIYLTINLIDRITPDLEELAELKKGNLAVALILSAALVLVVLAASTGMENLFSMIKSVESLFL